MLPANSDFEIGLHSAAFSHRKLYQIADTGLIDGNKRIHLQKTLFDVIRQKLAHVIARKAKRHLRKIIGTEAVKLRFFGQFL